MDQNRLLSKDGCGPETNKRLFCAVLIVLSDCILYLVMRLTQEAAQADLPCHTLVDSRVGPGALGRPHPHPPVPRFLVVLPLPQHIGAQSWGMNTALD